MTDKEFLYKLLYQALIEIREESLSIKNKKIFHLSNLLHSLPLILNRVKTDDEYKEVLSELEDRAEIDGLEKWIHNVKKQLT